MVRCDWLGVKLLVAAVLSLPETSSLVNKLTVRPLQRGVASTLLRGLPSPSLPLSSGNGVDKFAGKGIKDYHPSMMKSIRWMPLLACLALGLRLQADQVVMQNGDTLNGTVLSVSTNVLVLQNENLGKVTLSRTRVANIVFGSGTAKAANLPAPVTAAARTDSTPDLTSALHGLRDQTNLIQQVQSQVLGSAGPGAIGKFNDLLDGLSTGKIDMNDLRAQAQAAAEQLQSLKKDLGPGDSAEADSYLAILNNFLQETAPANVTVNSASPPTNAPPSGARLAP